MIITVPPAPQRPFPAFIQTTGPVITLRPVPLVTAVSPSSPTCHLPADDCCCVCRHHIIDGTHPDQFICIGGTAASKVAYSNWPEHGRCPLFEEE